MYSYTYKVQPGVCRGEKAEADLAEFIEGRYTAYERNIWTAVRRGQSVELTEAATGGYPFYNIIIPYQADAGAGLDGIELTFCTPTDREASYSVQVKDPLWYYRNLAHFTFRSAAGIQQKLWLDTRDRVLPEDHCLYITIAAEDAEAGACLMQSLHLRAVYKSAELAKKEHCEDRFTQAEGYRGASDRRDAAVVSI